MSAAAATEVLPGIFHPELPLDSIEPSKTNPRKHFDERELQELAQSIKDKGVIQPIVVRPYPKQGKASWEIVAGERRWRGSKLAGVVTIPAIERRLDDKAVLEIQVIENLQRSDIHPLEEANGYRDLTEKHKYTVEVIADKVGKSKEYVYARMKLADLIPQLQARFYEGIITAGHAILLARLPEASQLYAAKELFETDHYVDPSTDKPQTERTAISVRDLQSLILREIQMDLSKAKFDVTDPNLLKGAGACGACPKRTGAEPQLWPEVGKRDLCTDRVCFNKKLNAFIEDQASSGAMVKLTDDYSKRTQKGLIYDEYGLAKIKPGTKTCESAIIGIFVDGHKRGETQKICPNKSCKIHYRSNGSSTYERRIAPPAEQLRNAQQSINANMDAELRKKIYEAACQRLDILGTDLSKLATRRVLTQIMQLVYGRTDNTVRGKLTTEFGFKKEQYGNCARSGAVAKYAEKFDAGKLMALTIKFALRNLSLGFTSGWNSESKEASKELIEIATAYGVKTGPIEAEIAKLKKEKLAKAKKRIETAKKNSKSKKSKAQTSAKPEPEGEDPDPDFVEEDE